MAEAKLKHRDNPIPDRKINTVKELTDLIKNKRTVLIASIKNLPAAQLQEIGKSLRGKAVVKVPKKNLLFRAIDESGNKELQELKNKFDNSVAILFSDSDSFDLSADLLKNKSPAKAKPGQEAPADIEVQAGPTDLPPGPAISELGAVGLQVQIDKGKIMIREPKVIVKAGAVISQEAADVMSKLDIKPFSIGLIPLSAFDNETKTLYEEININSEEALADLLHAYGRALPFAVEIGYANSDTIGFLLGKAHAHEQALAKLSPAEEKNEEAPKEEEKPAEEKVEETQDQTPETKPEEAPAAETPSEEKPAEPAAEEKVEGEDK